MDYPSLTLQAAVDALARLPGIGKKTALRLALHVLKRGQPEADALGNALIALRRDTRRCRHCHNICDNDTCSICTNPRRNPQVMCVVEELQDLLAIERTGQYNGLYHVLGGIINPMAGIGPDQLHIDDLVQRLQKGSCQELVFALRATLEGETTAFYIAKKLQGLPVRLTHIARGIPVGSELEFTDELTLARSILQRTAYHNPITENN